MISGYGITLEGIQTVVATAAQRNYINEEGISILKICIHIAVSVSRKMLRKARHHPHALTNII